MPLEPAALDFLYRAGLFQCYLLADHPTPPGLQVLLFELDSVRMVELCLLACDLLARPVHYRFIAAPGRPPLRPWGLRLGEVLIIKVSYFPTLAAH